MWKERCGEGYKAKRREEVLEEDETVCGNDERVPCFCV